jgi:nitronate monooxygenase
MSSIKERVERFCRAFDLRLPLLLAPMAGVPAPSLSAAIAAAGGLGACGALLMSPAEIESWAGAVRAAGSSAFQINLWIPDPPPERNAIHEAAVRTFLARWGPEVPDRAGEITLPDFTAQCQALLRVHPPIVSSIMGLYPRGFVEQLKALGIAWSATVTTVAEARAAEGAGADLIVAQGMEAGGHRGCFEAQYAQDRLVGLMALLPAVVDAVRVPVVATGGIADARGIAAALVLGASAVQIGTGFLRCPEAQLHPVWAAALAQTAPEETIVSRVFSGRSGRSIATDYTRAATAPGAPAAAPYPVQRDLTAPMRRVATERGDLSRMQAWAGQSAHLARGGPAAALTQQLWAETSSLLAAARL